MMDQANASFDTEHSYILWFVGRDDRAGIVFIGWLDCMLFAQYVKQGAVVFSSLYRNLILVWITYLI